MKPRLSIIIPTFNEELRIGVTLDAIIKYTESFPQAVEIILVDDGSTDGTVSVAKKRMRDCPTFSVVVLTKNQGKGAAVRAGMLAAQGELRLFTDADNSTSIDQVDTLLPFMGMGFDIVIGSRTVPGARKVIRQSHVREILGLIFRALSNVLVPLGVHDSQNGFKLFKEGSAVDIFTCVQTKGWCFDVEALYWARRHGYRIAEVPIVWRNEGQSRMRVLHMFRMVIDLIHISWRRLN